MAKVKVYSDGSSRGNPGPGGYGTVVHYLNENDEIVKVDEYAAGFDFTTNNRMELMAVIVGLESINEQSDITVTSDSSYVVNAFNKYWIENWLKNNWKNAKGEDVKNKELWERLIDVTNKHEVTFVWIKGHNGHPENERCDELATLSADKIPLVKKDGKYEKIETEEETEKTTEDSDN